MGAEHRWTVVPVPVQMVHILHTQRCRDVLAAGTILQVPPGATGQRAHILHTRREATERGVHLAVGVHLEVGAMEHATGREGAANVQVVQQEKVRPARVPRMKRTAR